MDRIAPLAGAAWGVDILTGRKPFPTMEKPKKGEGFKEVLDKEMEKNVQGEHTRASQVVQKA